MRTHGLNCRVRTLGIPAVWGKGKETPGDWEKIPFFCLKKPGPTMVTAAFCLEHKEDKAT